MKRRTTGATEAADITVMAAATGTAIGMAATGMKAADGDAADAADATVAENAAVTATVSSTTARKAARTVVHKVTSSRVAKQPLPPKAEMNATPDNVIRKSTAFCPT